MKDEIRVGGIYVDSESKTERKVLFVGEYIVFTKTFNQEESWAKFTFIRRHALKKPEPTLKKLVVLVNKKGKLPTLCFEDHRHGSDWTKKELIVKNGSLYVDMSEVGK